MDHDQQIEKGLALWRRRYLSDDLRVKETTPYLAYDLGEEFAASKRHGHPEVWLIIGLFCGLLGLFAWLSDRYIAAQANKVDATLSDYAGVPLGDLLKTLDRLGRSKARLETVVGDVGKLREKIQEARKATPVDRVALERLDRLLQPKEQERASLTREVDEAKRELGTQLDKARVAAAPPPQAPRPVLRPPSERPGQVGPPVDPVDRFRDEQAERLRALGAIQKRLTDDLEALRRERAAEQEAFGLERERFAAELTNVNLKEQRLRVEVEARESRLAILAAEGRDLKARLAELEAALAARDVRITELEKSGAQSAERLRQLEPQARQLAWYRRYVDGLLRGKSEGATVIEAENPQSILVQVSGLYEAGEGSTGTVFHGESEYVATVAFFVSPEGLRARVTSLATGAKVRPLDRVVIHLR